MDNKNPSLQNLKPFKKGDKRTIEIARKGGLSVAKSKKKKKETKKIIDQLLCLDVSNAKLKEKIKEFGYEDEDITNQLALVVRTYNLAMNGDLKAISFLLKDFELSAMDKENIKLKKQQLKLQQERVQLEKERNEVLRKQIEDAKNGVSDGVVIINDLYGIESDANNGEND